MKKILSCGLLCLTLCIAISCTKNESSLEPSQPNTKNVRGNKSGNNLSWAVDLLVNESNFHLFAQKFSEINNEINLHMVSLNPAQRSAAIESVRQDGSPENVALNWGYTLSKEYEMDALYEQVMQNNPSLITIGMEGMDGVIYQALRTAPYLSYPCLSASCCWNYYNEAKANGKYFLKEKLVTQSQYNSFIASQQASVNNCLEDALW